jgi:hypothetical protein
MESRKPMNEIAEDQPRPRVPDERPKTWGPFSGRQLTTMFVALVIGAVLVPSTVWAVDTFSNVAIEDPVSGVKASVDAGHHQLVGDGSGPLTVNGTVSDKPVPPANLWSFTALFPFSGSTDVLLGPTPSRIEITSLTASEYGSPGAHDLTLSWRFVPLGSTSCAAIEGTPQYFVHTVDGPAFSASFPTPIEGRPASDQEVCLIGSGNGQIALDLGGYYYH